MSKGVFQFQAQMPDGTIRNIGKPIEVENTPENLDRIKAGFEAAGEVTELVEDIREVVNGFLPDCSHRRALNQTLDAMITATVSTIASHSA